MIITVDNHVVVLDEPTVEGLLRLRLGELRRSEESDAPDVEDRRRWLRVQVPTLLYRARASIAEDEGNRRRLMYDEIEVVAIDSAAELIDCRRIRGQ